MPIANSQHNRRTNDSRIDLPTLLQDQRIWQGRQLAQQRQRQEIALTTGFSALDRQLHLGGWPIHSSCELACEHYGIGEVQLLTPALQQLMQQGRHIAWLNPPYLINAEALLRAQLPLARCLLLRPEGLNEQLWATEQLLESEAFAAVISWFDQGKLADKSLRRLQQAAQRGKCWHIHFRPHNSLQQASPAHLRMRLSCKNEQLSIDILKQPSGWSGQRVLVPRNEDLLFKQAKVQQWPSYRRQPDRSVRNIDWIQTPSSWPNSKPKPAADTSTAILQERSAGADTRTDYN